ncbi:MAG TPA: hypothetical protein VG937_30065 [Polyangiaceae bacterium]|nr:hypothetical protein [Polyangiaceae bacterium]
MNSGSTPPAIEELARAGLEYVQRALDFGLDFQPETLSVLDHYASSVRSELEKNPALAALVAPALGAYFGEVVRAYVRGFWRVPSANQQDWSVCSRVVFLAINPIGVAYDALYGGTEHDGPRSTLRVAPEDSAYLDRRLATMPEVPEDEYFLFTTRFEVLEVALEALSAKMQEEGYGGTEYSEEDYGLDYN